MHTEDFNALKHKLEPEASVGDDSEYLLLSLAVSAKRIADALEKDGSKSHFERIFG